MPDRHTVERARRDERQGKAASHPALARSARSRS